MKRNLIFTTALLLFAAQFALAQNTHFTTDGVIEFDKTVNTFAIIKREMGKDPDNFSLQAFEQYQKNQPQFKVLKSTLSFAKNKTLFTPIEPETAVSMGWWGNNPLIIQNNTIYTDLGSNISICHKKVYEEAFLVKDSTRKINWKITTETRDILGYTCRRANAVIMDSIYVVAFYTEEIPVSGGPESFSGLPGMILGVALPHENINWFATKITDSNGAGKPFGPPTKGKPVDNKGLVAIINAALKSWGDDAKVALKAFTL